MHAFGGFVPSDRRAALASGTAFPEHVVGAALYCDVSGSTRLSARLVEAQGRHRGADALSGALGAVLDAIVARVHAGGGAVVAFAGDAVTCWFDDGGEPGSGTGRAAACALALCAEGEGALGVKAAVAGGEARRIVVGMGEIQLFDVLAGPLVDELAELHAVALPSDVLLSPATAARLAASGAGIVRRPAPGGGEVAVLRSVAAPAAAARRAPAEVPPDRVAQWAPRALRSLIGARSYEQLTDLRPVTPLFMGFGAGRDEGPGSDVRLAAIVAWAQKTIDDREGLLLDVTVGDKGRYLCGVFGAPVAHENDVERALDAALVLRRPPAAMEIGSTVRIGVSRGSALVGVVGSDARRRYGVVGLEMNLAAHVMTTAAPGDILVTALVAGLARRRFAVAPRAGRAALKGLDATVPLYAVAARRTDGPAAPAAGELFVEREAEAAAIGQAMADLAAGRGGVVLIESEAGLGKSRLIAAAHPMATEAGALWLASAADETRTRQPYHAWRDVFAALRARGLAGARDGAAEPLLRFVFDDSGAEPSELAALGGPDRAAAILGRLALILRAVARRMPLVLAMDELHWFDSASLALLLRLAGEGGRILLLLAGRPSPGPAPERAALAAAAGPRRLVLRPLSEDGILAVAARRLGAEALSYDLRRLIVERAGGSPLFAEEIAGVLRARALVRVDSGLCVPSPAAPRLDTVDFLESVETVVAARVDQLPLRLRQVLRVASVAGRTFDATLIQPAMDPADRPRDVTQTLERLRRDAFLVVESAASAPRFAMRHPMIREAIYQSIPFAQRRAIHARLADWWSRRTDAVAVGELARHLGHAVDHPGATGEEIDAAVAALDRAATQATRDFANVEAAAFFDTALLLLGRLPPGPARDRRELDMRARLALSLAMFRGYADESVERAYRRALDLADAAGDSPHLAFVVYGIFSFYSAKGDQAMALRTLRRLHLMALRSGDLPTRSVAHQSRGIVALLRGRVGTALAQLRRSYDLVEAHGDGAIFAHAGAGDFRTFTGTWIALGEAVAGRLDRAREMAVAAVSFSGAASFAGCFAQSFAPLSLLEGDAAGAASHARALIERAEAHGFALFSAVARIQLGWAETRLGGDAAALDRIDDGLRLTLGMRLGSFTPWLLALKADACLAVGRTEDARAALTLARSIVREQGETLFESEILRGEAAVAAADGAPADAVALLLGRAVAGATRRGALLLAARAAHPAGAPAGTPPCRRAAAPAIVV